MTKNFKFQKYNIEADLQQIKYLQVIPIFVSEIADDA